MRDAGAADQLVEEQRAGREASGPALWSAPRARGSDLGPRVVALARAAAALHMAANMCARQGEPTPRPLPQGGGTGR